MVLPVGGRKPGIPDRTGFELNTLFSGFDVFKDREESRRFDIRRFGAVADGSTDNAAAILAAIDVADAHWVVVPPGDVVTGHISVTAVARIRREEGARLTLPPGSHTARIIDYSGTELGIRGPGTISGNRHNTASRFLINGLVPEGVRVDIEGVHL